MSLPVPPEGFRVRPRVEPSQGEACTPPVTAGHEVSATLERVRGLTLDPGRRPTAMPTARCPWPRRPTGLLLRRGDEHRVRDEARGWMGLRLPGRAGIQRRPVSERGRR